MRALLVVSKAQATVRALSIRKAGATTLTLLAVSLCGPEPGTVWRARRAVAFYDRRQDTRAGAVRPRPFPFRVVRCYRTNLRASRATATTIAASIINFLKLTYLLLPKSVFVPD